METIKFIVNVEGCIIHKDKILMILRGDTESHAPNTLAFPGGQVESKDSDVSTLEDTIKREIYEEVGLKIVEHFEYLENKKFITQKGNNILDVVMFCKINDIANTKIDNDEVRDCMWMGVDEILNDVRTPEWIKKSVELIKQKLN
jgi:8-oxo-dGTP pyrophosphatase MutT (NUDIX family)